MKKLISIIMMCFILFGCNANKSTSGIQLNIEYENDVKMIKNKYVYTLNHDVVDFMNGLSLTKSDAAKTGNPIATLEFDRTLTIYDNQMIGYDGNYYSIDDEEITDYYWTMIHSDLIYLKDIIKEPLERVEVYSNDGIEYVVTIKEPYLTEFVNDVSNLVVLEHGAPTRAAGGYGYRFQFKDVVIEEMNGVNIVVDNEVITNKQSDIINGSLVELMKDFDESMLTTKQETDRYVIEKK
ncbi:MAG: hypothetical protein PUF50_03470 [Erysipelotrichaceae bacterium]|nr:hypothetical protein [Erysipelotrichaceae bacterium]